MENRIETAARLLADARRTGIPIDRLPENCRPAGSADALAIQRHVFELSGARLGGWKCSVPTGDRWLVAPLPDATIHRSSPCPVIPKGSMAQIEPEIAYFLKHDLPPRTTPYTEDDVRHAIGETRMVLELMASRYVDVGPITYFEALADSMRHQGMFVGPAVEGDFAAFHLSIEGAIEKDVRHPNEHPIKPVVWLANYLSSRGETLQAGKLITTGSYAGIVEVPIGSPVRICYRGIGEFTVEFRALP